MIKEVETTNEELVFLIWDNKMGLGDGIGEIWIRRRTYT
jgi:hypothetical protein